MGVCDGCVNVPQSLLWRSMAGDCCLQFECITIFLGDQLPWSQGKALPQLDPLCATPSPHIFPHPWAGIMLRSGAHARRPPTCGCVLS